MLHVGPVRSHFGLEHHGIRHPDRVWWNLSVPELYEHAIRRGEGMLAPGGALVVSTGKYTGRSPNDKYIVREPATAERIWWGAVNRPLPEERFDALYRRICAHLDGRELYVLDCRAGADPQHELRLRVITEHAWHALFARALFLPADPARLHDYVPQLTIIHAAGFCCEPEIDGTASEVCIVLHLARGQVLIGGTAYAGEIKKSVFTVLNYLLPDRGVLPMHCAANVGPAGDVALFFGLSGTGKTTLSADPERSLIGDDEHGWSESGVFNLEGGCYAKVINLSAEAEPQIYAAVHRFGTVLENVVLDPVTREPDFTDDSLTENTRAAYPVEFIPRAVQSGMGGHPRHILFLTADAFGVLPPVARLTPEQAMYHFLLGYTAKVAGTERGVVEPEATFSACFGAPFLPLPPQVYASMLGEKIARHGAQVWLINTGWSGGPYGVGQRMKLALTRAIVRAVLNGTLQEVAVERDPIFGLYVPVACPHVPPEVLNPRQSWSDPQAYDHQARRLARMFAAGFAEFAASVPPEVRAAGPLTV